MQNSEHEAEARSGVACGGVACASAGYLWGALLKKRLVGVGGGSQPEVRHSAGGDWIV